MAENYVLLETINLTQSAASVTFDNIPQSGYTDLKIVASFRGTTAQVYEITALRFNGLNANLSSKSIEGSGSAASSISNSFIYFGSGDGANATANTFSNIEAYIPNYTSSNYKSVSIDSVGETNGTTIYSQLTAGLWSNTAAITSVEIVPTGSFVQYSTFSLYGVAALGTTPTVAPLATGGNIVANDGTYWYHAFITSGTFTPQTDLTCDALVVAGGGGGGGTGNGTNGGYPGAGGGGAGGYRLLTSQSLTSATAQLVTIGAGGAGKIYTGGYGTSGSNSVFGSITSAGGGGGASHGTGAGAAGGSGGGASTNTASGGAGNTPSTSPSQGNNGGGYTGGDGAGGGGGAGAAGSNNSSTSGGAGGAGSNSASSWASVTGTGVSGYFAGGGGGASYSGGSGGAGGSGGGGAGGTYNGASTGVSATANTGSGGGGASMSSPTVGLLGGNGGSGIVIIRYAM